MTSAWDREKSDKFYIPEFTELGYNYKMSDITAAVGVTQFQTQIGTYASHIQPIYNSTDKCHNSLDIFNRSLALPYMLKEEDIDVAASHLKTRWRN